MERDDDRDPELEIDNELHNAYFDLRSGTFTRNEIEELVLAAKSGDMLSVITESLSKERLDNKEWLDSINNIISEAEQGVNSLLDKYDIALDRDKPAPVVGMGKYQGMFVYSINNGHLAPFPAGGWYFSESDTIYLKDKKDKFSSSVMTHLIVHEMIHSVSTKKIPDEHELMKADTADGFQCGFSLNEDGNRFQLHGLNEGVTDLFAREVSDNIGFDKDEQHNYYQEEVSSLKILLNHLFEGGDDEESRRWLLSLYCADTGLDDFKQVLKERIGKYGPELVELLFIKPDELDNFLQATLEKDSDKKIEVKVDLLRDLDSMDVMKHHSSIVCIDYVKDEKGEYKKIYL